MRHKVINWGVWEAALALAAYLPQQVNARRQQDTSRTQQQDLTSLLVEVGQVLPLSANELQKCSTPCWYERTIAPPRQQPQLLGKCSTPPVGMSAPAPRPASCSSPGHGCQDGLKQAAAGAEHKYEYLAAAKMRRCRVF